MSVVLAATHSHRTLIWGIVLVVIGTLHLAFRRFYARRAAAVESARKETAPGPLRGRALYITGGRPNMIWVVGSSAVMVVVGVVLIATSA
jgi:hypothetical protein